MLADALRTSAVLSSKIGLMLSRLAVSQPNLDCKVREVVAEKRPNLKEMKSDIQKENVTPKVLLNLFIFQLLHSLLRFLQYSTAKPIAVLSYLAL